MGLNDTLESGKSLTVGLNYSKEKKDLNDINRFFELKLATVIREKEQNNIPKKLQSIGKLQIYSDQLKIILMII